MSVKFQSTRAPVSIEVPTYPNLNLLAHAQMEELEIGSQCGGHGICGADRIQVRALRGQLSEPTGAEQKHLGAEALAAGWRLGCQCYPQSDDAEIEVGIPPAQPPVALNLNG